MIKWHEMTDSELVKYVNDFDVAVSTGDIRNAPTLCKVMFENEVSSESLSMMGFMTYCLREVAIRGLTIPAV